MGGRGRRQVTQEGGSGDEVGRVGGVVDIESWMLILRLGRMVRFSGLGFEVLGFGDV